MILRHLPGSSDRERIRERVRQGGDLVRGVGAGAGYTVAVARHAWNPSGDARAQLRDLSNLALTSGVLVVEFARSTARGTLPWTHLEPWTRSRAVTVADVRCSLQPPALDVALCCDIVYVRDGARLILPEPEEPPTAGVVWALARAGPAAMARGLLAGGALSEDEAVRLGLAQARVADDRPLPLTGEFSLAALTTARDLMRSRSTGRPGLVLELASFRLLFATGDPEEGARAFLERRPPEFGRSGSCSDKPGE